MPFIELIVSPQGHTLLQTKGFSGADCRAASEFLEVALGKRTHEQLTTEFHEPIVTQSAVASEQT